MCWCSSISSLQRLCRLIRKFAFCHASMSILFKVLGLNRGESVFIIVLIFIICVFKYGIRLMYCVSFWLFLSGIEERSHSRGWRINGIFSSRMVIVIVISVAVFITRCPIFTL